MAKEFQKFCPDCDGPDMGSLFNKGDGRCHECHGSGVDEVSSVFNTLVNADKDPCNVCSGTGQCQTCGGSGYEFYNDDEYDNSDAYKSSTSNSGSSTDYSSSNYSDYSANYSPSRSAPSDDSNSSGILGFIVLIVLGVILFNWYKSCQNKPAKRSNYKETTQVISQPVENKPYYNQNLMDGKWVKIEGISGGARNDNGLIISFENDIGTAIYIPPSAFIEEGQILWKNFNAKNNWIQVYVSLSGGYLNSEIYFIDSNTIRINFDRFKRK